MNKLMVLLLVLFTPSLARADVTAVPDLTGWQVSNISRLDFKPMNSVTVHLGFIVDYENPNNPQEFVRVIKRCIPFISAPGKIKGTTSSQEKILLNYVKRAEDELVDKLYNESDSIAYIRWITKIDPQTNEVIQSGNAEYWLLKEGFAWIFSSQEKMVRENLSEPLTSKDGKIILVGLKLSLGDGYYILRISRADLAVLSSKGEVKYDLK